MQVFAIVDRDAAEVIDKDAVDLFHWDVYHIENYLLEPKYILKVLEDLRPERTQQLNEASILEELKSCAGACLAKLVAHELRSFANSILIRCLDLRVNETATDPAAELARGISTSVGRVAKVAGEDLNEDAVRAKRLEVERRMTRSLGTQRWKQDFRGREILAEFAGRHLGGLGYEGLRNLIIARMSDDNFQPKGMKKVLEFIEG